MASPTRLGHVRVPERDVRNPSVNDCPSVSAAISTTPTTYRSTAFQQLTPFATE
ncbi:MAG: hypothetical protein M3Z54_13105 [Gemmatimonadota bacterium]|nr:hypothetical protein [Gemmatimonadota bacterium]